MNGLLNNRKGTTLVEILVVMVILLVGIMTIVMMFPSGFSVVLAAESQTIATKLAQAEIERWKNMPGNLPDGILPITVDYDATPPQNSVLNDQPPGPDFDGFTATGSPDYFEPGNSVNYRYVRNEIATIPVGSYFTTGGGAVYGSRYTLACSPIEVSADPAHPNLFSGLSIKSGDLQRREGDSGSYMYLRPGQYGIDYNQGNSTFYVCFSYDRNPDHVYYLSYSYWIVKNDSNGSEDTQLISEVDRPISPRADGDWVAVDMTVPSGYDDYEVSDVEPNTDSCARGFVQVQASTGGSTYWSDDPYEFALADSIMGVVAFNPRARNMVESTARGTRPISARIDYRIYDPRIIREDKVVQEANEDTDNNGEPDHTAIKLALRFILNAGLPNDIHDGDATDNPDEPTFEGLVRTRLGQVVRSTADLSVSQSMLIVDLATGLRVSMTHVSIDFKTGVVHLPRSADLIDWSSQPLPDTADVPLRGRHLRFFYRADGDWSVQCQKAYTYYLRKTGAEPVDYCHFRLSQPSSGLNQLLFARCEAGKSVVVDYSYVDSSGNPHKVVGKLYRISDDWTSDPTVPSKQCTYLNLDAPAGATFGRIVVAGVSFRARVIWRDGKHWRFRDIDTDLTRNSMH